jgi:hypothetical protein
MEPTTFEQCPWCGLVLTGPRAGEQLAHIQPGAKRWYCPRCQQADGLKAKLMHAIGIDADRTPVGTDTLIQLLVSPPLDNRRILRHPTMPTPKHPMTRGQALQLAIKVIDTAGWSAYHALGRDIANPRATWFVVIATHRASGREYVLEEPDQWPITRAIHAA